MKKNSKIPLQKKAKKKNTGRIGQAKEITRNELREMLKEKVRLCIQGLQDLAFIIFEKSVRKGEHLAEVSKKKVQDLVKKVK